MAHACQLKIISSGLDLEDAALSVLVDSLAEAPLAEVIDGSLVCCVECGAAVGRIVVDFNPIPPGPKEILSLATVVVT